MSASGATPPAPTIAAPDPETRVPAFRLPPVACDAHCHIFGPATRYPYAAQRPYTPPDAGLAEFEALHATIGVTRAVIVNASIYGTDNAVVIDAIASGDGRYRGVANVDDTVSERDLLALHESGIRGCRFNFVQHLGGVPDMAVFDRVMTRIAKLDWHVDLHFDAVDLPAFTSMLRRLPVRYTIDHMGRPKAADGLDQPAFMALLDLLRTDRHCWVKVSGCERVSTAGPPFHDALPFARRIIETAPDRVVWGTDWPHPNVRVMPNDGDLVDLLPLMAPERDLQQRLLVDNPARLFGFDR